MKVFFSEGKLNFKIGNKIAWFDRKRLTFLLTVYDLKTKEDKMYYMQYSTKDMWLIPKRDTICDGTITLWGWLFFYVGCNTEMLEKKCEV